MDSNERGFTLIEVMVALTLLGIIASLLASGTRLSLDASARGNSKAEAIRTEQIERDVLRRQLQGALPFRYWNRTESKREERVAFEGESDRIRFVSRHGTLEGPDSLPRWVELRKEQMPGGLTKLILEEHRILSPDNEPSETVMARSQALSCDAIRFQYLDTTGQKPEWLAAWTGSDRKAPLPFAIRIQCTNADATAALLIALDYADAALQGMSLE